MTRLEAFGILPGRQYKVNLKERNYRQLLMATTSPLQGLFLSLRQKSTLNKINLCWLMLSDGAELH